MTPSLFVQLFTILGIYEENAVLLVYAVLTGKFQELYTLVLERLKEYCGRYNIDLPDPVTVISDFELAIINSCKEVIRNARFLVCYFHLGQSMNRKIQEEGLQVAYRDPEDREIKTAVHMMLALAFLPVQDVIRAFEELRRESPQELLLILDYFESTYLRARRARTRRPRAAGLPLYPIPRWNQHEAALTGGSRTNNLYMKGGTIGSTCW